LDQYGVTVEAFVGATVGQSRGEAEFVQSFAMIEILDGNRLVKLKYGFDSRLKAFESMMD
jgi:hypothetical protein